MVPSACTSTCAKRPWKTAKALPRSTWRWNWSGETAQRRRSADRRNCALPRNAPEAAGSLLMFSHAASSPEIPMKREYPDRPIVGVGAVIIEDGLVLLVRRAHLPLAGLWSSPVGEGELYVHLSVVSEQVF